MASANTAASSLSFVADISVWGIVGLEFIFIQNFGRLNPGSFGSLGTSGQLGRLNSPG
ncbi:hypothetical protein D3C78_1776310 [compost metagenome]